MQPTVNRATINGVLAARRYYLDGATKSEIAWELGISRFRVARLLDEARRDGIVRIEIDSVPEIDAVLSRELAVRHGIRSAVVVRTVDGPEEFRRSQLGRAAAMALAEALEDADVLGISWGRTLQAMIGQLPRLPGCPVVQLVGSVPSLDLAVNSLELLRRVAEQTRGPVYPLHVPLVVDSAATAASLRQDLHVAQTIRMFGSVRRAVVGIGAWAPDGSTVRAALSPGDCRALDRAGTVAEVCAIALDGEGKEVRAGGLPERCIAIGAEELRSVPDVLAVAGGVSKVDAIRAVLRSGLIHRLVTNDEAARLLMEAA